MDFRNRKVTVMGLGHFGGGVGAARWLAQQGAIVTVTDLADETTLADSLTKLNDVPIAASHLGGHREVDFRSADLLIVNPAVRPGNPFLKIACDAGVPIRCELELFLNVCPAKTIGVTGSNGKSTTAAMIAAILQNAGQVGNLSCQTWLGGNLGGSLLENVEAMRPNDWVVLEISSFQLWHFSPRVRMPRIAVVTGCTPNHLDWHGTFAEYAAAKQKMLDGQSSTDAAVLNALDAEVAAWRCHARGRVIWPYPLAKLPAQLPVLGDHNCLNAALAAAAALEAGCTDDQIKAGLENFRGLPQRLELVGEFNGRCYFNDSAATTPESTIAALKSLNTSVWLLAGGRNKGFDFAPLADAIARRARGAALFGESAKQLHSMLLAARADFPSTSVAALSQALAWCNERAAPGDAILLSPGCASTDQFQNFQKRGGEFVEQVHALHRNRVDRD
jgi:UDP-N-acetylmuramoylalanine--D-glutamate ligase